MVADRRHRASPPVQAAAVRRAKAAKCCGGVAARRIT